MKRWYKVLSILLCFMLLAWATMQPASAVIDVALVAGGVMTVGLVVSICICAAAAAGMSEALNETASNVGLSTPTFVNGKLGEYCQQNGMTLASVLRLFMDGVAISPGNPFDAGSLAGSLILSAGVASFITGFLNYLWNGTQNDTPVEENGTVEDAWPQELTINGYTLYKYFPIEHTLSNGNTVYYDYTKPAFITTNANTHQATNDYIAFDNSFEYPCYVMRYGSSVDNGNFRFVIFTPTEIIDGGSCYRVTVNTSTGTSNKVSSNVFTKAGSQGTGYTYGLFVATSGTSSWYSYPGYFGTGSATAPLNNVTWNDIYGREIEEGYKENPNALDPSKLPDLGAKFVLQIGETVKEDEDNPDYPPDVIMGKLPAGDYINQVAKAYSGEDTNIKITLEDDTTADVPIELEDEYTGVLDDAAAIPYVIAAEDSVVAGEAEQVAEATEDMELDDYTLDLRDFFPFCIPFDLYNMLKLFDAEPEAPSINWRFYAPGIVDQTLTFDLSSFDTVAAVLRRIELIACGIGLAFLTKSLIQGGD